MKKLFLVLFTICIPLLLSAQGAWTQKAAIAPGQWRSFAASFSLDGKGFLSGGLVGTVTGSATADLWQYDPVTDTWLQKANFPGTARYSAVAAVANGKAYVGTGTSSGPTSLFNDWYEYDPQSNTWTEKTAFPGAARQGAFAFSLNGTLYVGGGFSGSNYFTDVYAYNPAADTWAQKASLPGPFAEAVCFTAGGLGFTATGRTGNAGNPFSNSVYAYNPASNTWTVKAPFAGAARLKATGLSINAKGYLGGGSPGTGFTGDWWEYDLATDSWTQSLSLPSAVGAATAFEVNNKGYMIGRFGGANSTLNWEYAPAGSVSAGPVVSTCASSGPQQLAGTPAGGVWTGPGISSSGMFTPASAGTFVVTYSTTVAGQAAWAATAITVMPATAATFLHTHTGSDYKFIGPPAAIAYHWDFGDGDTSSLQSPVHTFAIGSTYPVTLTTTNYNSCTANTTQLISTIVGMAEPTEQQAELEALGDKLVRVRLPANAAGQLRFYTLQGREVVYRQLSAGQSEHLVPVPGLAQGLYVVQVACGSSTKCLKLAIR